MYLDRILYPVTALGPGNRVAVWVAGCNKKCKGCANPELWIKHPEQEIPPEKVAMYINGIAERGIDGITLTGGEPFDQAKELLQLIDSLDSDLEVLAFSGYKIDELRNDCEKGQLLDKIDVLIDGEYIDSLNDGVSALIGSTNQRIHILNNEAKDKYEQYISEGRKIQTFVYEYKTLLVGIHNSTRK
jgi:anaerobic ribonucleoside-triphosphate reductase-activating protein